MSWVRFEVSRVVMPSKNIAINIADSWYSGHVPLAAPVTKLWSSDSERVNPSLFFLISSGISIP